MKKSILLTLFTLYFSISTPHCFAQQGQWTWMNGSNVINATGVYGTQGVFAPTNTPPGLYEACEWTDLYGNFWLFGGSNNTTDRYSDLWEFKPSINQWAWIKGPGNPNQYGVYGTQNIPSSLNNPGARGFGTLTWVDNSGDLWLFGGGGYSINASGVLNDLWKYNIASNEWTWMAGPNTTNDLGSYGTIMVSSPSNNPPSRGETNASWTDSNNCLWLFGGTGSGNFSDLWKFDISNNQWTWMKGPNITYQPGTYGTLGVPDPANNPSARYVYSKWKDSNGNFWLFGGATSEIHLLNDMWRFNPITNEWTWMSGTNVYNDSLGVRGTICSDSTNNLPSARFETRACWKRSCDNFEFFGGSTAVFFTQHFYNDLWNYNVNTNEWTWISGSSIPNDTGNYGTILVSSSTNMPPSRYGAIGWTDTAGNLWLFGSIAYRNDMWRFVPDTTCPAIGAPVTVTSAFTAQPFSGCDSLTVSFSNTSVNGTSYNWNFGDTTYSNAINPTHTFTSSGTYLVQLIANAGCAIHPDTSTQTITVFSNPTPSITGNISFCQGDSSTLNADSFAQYHWSTGSSTQSISVYTSSIYSVTVTNSNGCTGTASQTVTVNPNPTPVIIGDSSICSGDSSLLDAGSYSQYLWSTGSMNETITVNTTNTYIVTVTNGFGCTGTTSKAVTVNPYSQADFVTYDTIGCTPYTVNYVNLSTNAASYLWYFGNNDSSTYTSPSYVYHTSGLYTVTLIAYGAGGCNDTLVRSDYITVGSTMDTIHLSFTMSPTSGCDSLTVHFQNTTLAGTYWLWNFGDGHTDTMQSPVHTYDSTGIFHVELSCYYHTLCGTFYPPSVYSWDTIYAMPVSGFNASNNSGCIPDTIQFNNTSTNANTYLWDFGDSSPTSTATNPSHIYTTTGHDTVTLICFGNGGCNDTMRFPVTILQEPSVSCTFTANPLSGCSPVTVDFTNTSINGTSYLWNFGDFNSDTTTNPVHTFDSSGTFIVKLITINNSSICGIVRDTATTTITVYPQAHASFTADTLTGCSPFTVHFINNSSNATSYLWNLGNNNTSTAINPSFTYDTLGSYTITLIAYSTGGCNDTMIQTNYITINTLPTVSSFFVADTFSGCNPLTVNFINTSNNGTSYQWNFGDSSTVNTINATHTYTDSGTFKVILVATNTGPCGVVTDTSTQQTTIRVDEPIKVTSSFTAEPLSGCSPLAVTFVNSSINGANYYWYFGDGGFDSIKSPVHIYDSGTYHIYLIAFNNTNRCTNPPDSTGLLITVDNCELSIPNVFSPNGDGKNDFFNLIAEGYTNFHLIIFDRWGMKIFESSNASNEWNGKVNNTGGECPDGTYYYIFSANDINSKPLSLKGFITLIR